MNIRYSSCDETKLLQIIDSNKHLGDIDCFLDLAQKIQNELKLLESRVDWCLRCLSEEICLLERKVEEAQGKIEDAQQAIQNTPVVEIVYPHNDSIQKGEYPITHPINGDIIAKYKDTILYQQKTADGCNNQLLLLRLKERSLQEGAVKISRYLVVASEMIGRLEYARKNAQSDCNKFRQAINDAAICMERYINIRALSSSVEAVRHIDPKE